MWRSADKVVVSGVTSREGASWSGAAVRKGCPSGLWNFSGGSTGGEYSRLWYEAVNIAVICQGSSLVKCH